MASDPYDWMEPFEVPEEERPEEPYGKRAKRSIAQCRKYGGARRSLSGKVFVFPFLCGNWACKECGPRNQARLRYRLSQIPEPPAGMLTLTVDPKVLAANSIFVGTVEEREWFKAAWSRLRQRLQRSPMAHADFAYFWTKELHKDGRIHQHVLLWGFGGRGGRLTRSQLARVRRAALGCGFGRSHWAPSRGSGERAWKYITKATSYITKMPTDLFQVPVRRYGASQGLLPKHEPSGMAPDGSAWDEESPIQNAAVWALLAKLKAAYGEPGWENDRRHPENVAYWIFRDDLYRPRLQDDRPNDDDRDGEPEAA